MSPRTTTPALVAAVAALTLSAVAQQQQPQMSMFGGTVLETTNASRYTYVRLDTGTTNVWAAGPTVDVKAGDKVTLAGAFPMRNFHSQSLNRTFDVLYFASGIVSGKAGGGTNAASVSLPAGHPPVDSAMEGGLSLPAGHPRMGAGGAAALDVSGIERAPGGKTVAEVWAERKALAGQSVTVRGKVVRVVTQVLGHNWLHLRDGTGAEGQNDLTVTTTDTAKVGDVVTLTGTVAVDRDFGGGYTYAVIVEKATLAR